jgi:hypothetical protein
VFALTAGVSNTRLKFTVYILAFNSPAGLLMVTWTLKSPEPGLYGFGYAFASSIVNVLSHGIVGVIVGVKVRL